MPPTSIPAPSIFGEHHAEAIRLLLEMKAIIAPMIAKDQSSSSVSSTSFHHDIQSPAEGSPEDAEHTQKQFTTPPRPYGQLLADLHMRAAQDASSASNPFASSVASITSPSPPNAPICPPPSLSDPSQSTPAPLPSASSSSSAPSSLSSSQDSSASLSGSLNSSHTLTARSSNSSSPQASALSQFVNFRSRSAAGSHAASRPSSPSSPTLSFVAVGSEAASSLSRASSTLPSGSNLSPPSSSSSTSMSYCAAPTTSPSSAPSHFSSSRAAIVHTSTNSDALQTPRPSTQVEGYRGGQLASAYTAMQRIGDAWIYSVAILNSPTCNRFTSITKSPHACSHAVSPHLVFGTGFKICIRSSDTSMLTGHIGVDVRNHITVEFDFRSITHIGTDLGTGIEIDIYLATYHAFSLPAILSDHLGTDFGTGVRSAPRINTSGGEWLYMRASHGRPFSHTTRNA
ncbi:hypothetical protein CF326_g8961 [Tilletia indica]|nr:hypothetical protein CF326_g8961 [Tilletia indica]